MHYVRIAIDLVWVNCMELNQTNNYIIPSIMGTVVQNLYICSPKTYVLMNIYPQPCSITCQKSVKWCTACTSHEDKRPGTEINKWTVWHTSLGKFGSFSITCMHNNNIMWTSLCTIILLHAQNFEMHCWACIPLRVLCSIYWLLFCRHEYNQTMTITMQLI